MIGSKHIATASLFTVLTSLPAHAAIVDLHYELVEPSSSFFADLGPINTAGTSFSPDPSATYSGAINAGDTLNVIFSAPAGYNFLTSPKPAAATGYSLNVLVSPSALTTIGSSAQPTSFSFSDSTGPAPASGSGELTVFPVEQTLLLEFNMGLTDAFEFHSFTLSFIVPAATSASYTQDSFSQVDMDVFAYFGNGTDEDPTPLLSLVPTTAIPEPASMAVLTLTSLALTSRRRRARRR